MDSNSITKDQTNCSSNEEQKNAPSENSGNEQNNQSESEWNVVTKRNKTDDDDINGQVSELSTQSQLINQDAPSTKAANKKKKKQSKKQKEQKKAAQQLFMRNVSESYQRVKDVQYVGEFTVHNVNESYKDSKTKTKDGSESDDKTSSSEYDTSSNEEIEDYHIDGYHPCHVNEIIDSRYVLLKKLGFGHFSTVWLALKLQDKELYALKIQKSAEKYTESALEEEEILYDVASNYKNVRWEKSVRKYLKDPKLELARYHTHNLQMFDMFFHNGPNGKHSVMAFEVLGKNLLNLIKKYDYRGIPMHIVRKITMQMLMGLDYMHRVCNIIHTDLKPENVVFGISEQQKFEMLYKYVLQTPLVELYDHTEPILLNKKQQKNQKKKDRKKKKKQLTKNTQVNQSKTQLQDAEETKDEQQETNSADNNADETEQAAIKQEKKTKADLVIEQMRQVVKDSDAQLFMEHFYVPQRSRSQQKGRTVKILDDPENAGIYIAYEHPLRSYAKYLKNFKEDFQTLRMKICSEKRNEELNEKESQERDLSSFTHKVLKMKPKRHFRVRSEQPSYRSTQQKKQFKQKDSFDIAEIREFDFQVRLCDMGNACYVEKHYSDVIQTREYRGPEVILDGEYNESADVWSLACLIFELVTGDYLFDPKKGKTYKKNDDHLALISELIGEPRDLDWLKSNDAWEDFYTAKGKLKRIKNFKKWPLYSVLSEKYRVKPSEAQLLTNFLLRMLKWNPKDRAKARDLLDDPWLKMAPNQDTHMSREHKREWKILNNMEISQSSSSSSESQNEESEEDNTDSDHDNESENQDRDEHDNLGLIEQDSGPDECHENDNDSK